MTRPSTSRSRTSRTAERDKAVFYCQDCGHESPRWNGFCPSPACGSQRPLVEAPSGSRAGAVYTGWRSAEPEPLQELSALDAGSQPRIALPCQELNRVLGGGIVPGSVVLLAGEPGIGKSTLMLQIAQHMSARGEKVLYLSGEESPQQIKLRAQRLDFPGNQVFLLSETDVDLAVQHMEAMQPALAIVDSIQTLYSCDVPSGPGSVVQIREAGLRLMRWAKARHVPVLVAGHVTKDGNAAGPRVLEHMVDVVTYLETQESGALRTLHSVKNRFGSTNEVGVFEMTAQGLAEVSDPSHSLLAQRYDGAVGAALAPVMEGSRPLLIEIQALTSQSQLPVPRRVANGVDHNRLLMLAAVASRRASLELSGQDIIVNVAGGLRINDPTVDLALVLAMASSFHNRPLDPKMVAFGEVGLSGELRSVSQAQRRILEARRLGMERCILPETAGEDGLRVEGMRLELVRTVRQAIRMALGGSRGETDLNLA